MKVKELMSTELVVCTPEDDLGHAAWLMWQHDRGFLPVVERASGKVVGTLTDRDACMATCIRGEPLSRIPVSAAMARRPVTCSESDDPGRVLDTLAKEQLHRLPVVDAEQRLIGVVTLNDVARAKSIAKAVGIEKVGRTLAAIAKPRSAATPRADTPPPRSGGRRVQRGKPASRRSGKPREQGA